MPNSFKNRLLSAALSGFCGAIGIAVVTSIIESCRPHSVRDLAANFIFPSVEEKILSSVEKKFDQNKYIKTYISQGRFVPLVEKDFASEKNEIRSAKFSEIDSNRYATSKELDQVENDLQSSLKTVQSILDAGSRNSFTVEIYQSEREGEEEKMILNGKNKVISHWIKTGYCYKITPTPTKEDRRLYIEIEVHKSGVTRLDEQETYDSIGRLHQNHISSLFTGRTATAGINEVDVHLTPQSENCDDLRKSRRSD